ncbi:MAG: EAL domain-containing protein [Paracoccus sp. (in: a-proteobacteria)]|uniref:EAL domain-containing protein n=1 Tax=Paracoccus sp. TaxID=267 RepID=UPI00391B1127
MCGLDDTALRGLCIFGLSYTDQLMIAGGDRLVRAVRDQVIGLLCDRFGCDRVSEAPASGWIVVTLVGDSRAALADLVRQALDRIPGCRVQAGGAYFSTAAFAGIIWSDDGGGDPAALTRQAAAACAMAGARGTDLVEYDASDSAAVLAATNSAFLLSDAMSAMEDSRLILHAQPIIDLNATRPTSFYEVLVKMQDANGRIHAPLTFLPLVERTHMICIMDEWIIRKAILGHAADLGLRPDINISLNVSGRTLSGAGFWRKIDRIMTEAAVDPARIQFEVTESSAIHDFAQARANVTALRAMGCLVALDDFGAGLSGFSYLTDLEVDCVKLDGRLVANVVCPDRRELRIIEAIVGLCDRLGLMVVGEHVSSREILEALRDLGVTRMQGYFTGGPVLYTDVFAAPRA